MRRGLLFAAVVALTGFVMGATPDVFDTFRLGSVFDAKAFAQQGGHLEASDFNLSCVGYSYAQYESRREGLWRSVQVSKEERVIGVWTRIPCTAESAKDRMNEIKDRLVGLYRDKLESYGAARGEVEICVDLYPPDAG